MILARLPDDEPAALDLTLLLRPVTTRSFANESGRRVPAFYPVPVRRIGLSPPAFFRSHLTMGTLAFGYSVPVATACQGPPPETQHAWHTKKRTAGRSNRPLSFDPVRALFSLRMMRAAVTASALFNVVVAAQVRRHLLDLG